MCQSALMSTNVECLISVKDWMDNIDPLLNRYKLKRINQGKEYAVYRVCHRDFISYLVNTALVLEVRMKPTNLLDPPYISSIRVPVNVLIGLFNDKESADVVFEVGGRLMQDVESKHEAARTETTYIMYAHSIIFARRRILPQPFKSLTCHPLFSKHS